MLKSSLEGIGMIAIGGTMSVHTIIEISCWLFEAAQKLPESNRQVQACSFIEVDELCNFIAKEAQTLDLGRDRF